jgi:CheY-like chemotaxis protein
VNGVLDLSKVEAGRTDLYLETFDACQMVQDVVTTVQPLVQRRANKLEVRCPPGSGPMHADLTKVRQVLFNLLSNAAKFTERGVVTVAVERESTAGRDWFVVRVTDTGIGMTADQLKRVFEPFTQADASTTRKYGGTGLGLAISKRFAELMGGDLSATSAPGKGSAFVLRLPARVVLPAPVPAAADLARSATTDAGADCAPVVLVVDDDPAVRDLMTRFLTTDAPGARAITAADGEAGLASAREARPNLIFLDVLMPRMDGWAVLAALKADPELANIPVVMMTIANDTEMGYVLGASEYLTKPVDRERLAAVLGKYRPAVAGDVVLLVEDDPATREVLRRTLQKEEWVVAEAENGRVALDRLREREPTLILLDLMMPEMDGFEFLEELRRDEARRALPVVVLTSKDLTPEERERLSGNVERILQKGAYTREALLREVRAIVTECVRKSSSAGTA